MNYIPYVIEKTGFGERTYDIYSRLLKDRIIMLNGEINDNAASSIIAQLLFLDTQDSKNDISLYINSPGGVISSGLAIFDTMNLIKSNVSTICIGQAASMAAFLLSSGASNKRFSLPNSRIMIHQPSGGTQGQSTDIQIQAKEIQRLKDKLNSLLSKQTQKTVAKIEKDTERDMFMSPEEAKSYGLIDSIITNIEI